MYSVIVSEDLSKVFADAVSNGNVRILRVSIEHGKLLPDFAVAIY